MSLKINSYFYHQLISMMKVMFFSKLIDEILSTCQKNKNKIKKPGRLFNIIYKINFKKSTQNGPGM